MTIVTSRFKSEIPTAIAGINMTVVQLVMTKQEKFNSTVFANAKTSRRLKTSALTSAKHSSH